MFLSASGMGTTATVIYKRLASLLAEKHNRAYNTTLYWLGCGLNCSLLQSAIMCLHGSCLVWKYSDNLSSTETIDLACSEGLVQTLELLNFTRSYLNYFMNLFSIFSLFQVSSRVYTCLLYTSPSPRDATLSRMPSSA